MEDTPRHIRELVYRTIMARSEEERFLMCAGMYETSRKLAKIGMPDGLSELEQQAFIFQRIHGATPEELI